MTNPQNLIGYRHSMQFRVCPKGKGFVVKAVVAQAIWRGSFMVRPDSTKKYDRVLRPNPNLEKDLVATYSLDIDCR